MHKPINCENKNNFTDKIYKDVNCKSCDDIEIVELTNDEFEAIRYRDISKYTTKQCSKKMNITEKKFKKILESARSKVSIALESEKCLKLIIKEEIEDNKIEEDDLFEMKCCKFRCAICGCVYYINYESEDILCPKCSSKKVMTSEDAGFCKKWMISK